MELHLAQALQARQPQIRRRWETLLRDEPVRSALADPGILARLFDTTLGELFGVLRATPERPRGNSDAYSRVRAGCGCGRNPLVAYFLTGEQALLETLEAVEEAEPRPPATAAAELHFVMRQIARREVDAFCSLCQYGEHGGGAWNIPRTARWRGHPQAPREPAMAMAIHA
ncbi:MAG TPA: hypothetical protein VG838_03420 [Opitutaceae bacterium]|nr:hypothetical protein [Opitutaceae bacterium]